MLIEPNANFILARSEKNKYQSDDVQNFTYKMISWFEQEHNQVCNQPTVNTAVALAVYEQATPPNHM